MEPHLPDFKTSLSPHISIPENQRCTYSVMSNSDTLLPLSHTIWFLKKNNTTYTVWNANANKW